MVPMLPTSSRVLRSQHGFVRVVLRFASLASLAVLCGHGPKHSFVPTIVSKVVRHANTQRRRGLFLTARTALPEADDTDDEVSKELHLAKERLTRSWNEGGSSSAAGSFSLSPSGADWTVERLQITDGLPPVGSVLLADPRSYFSSDGGAAAVRSGRVLFQEGSRRDKATLPVVLLTHVGRAFAQGLLLGAWTGKLMGDLGMEDFMTRPLYHGGVNESGLSMLHSYPNMPGSFNLTADGLAWSKSDDFSICRHWVDTGPGSSLRFKFFMRAIMWEGEEVSELSPKAGVWIPVRVSRDLLLREPDSSFEEPLWVQYAQKAGGELHEIAREFGLFPDGA